MQTEDFKRIEEAIVFIRERQMEQPSLEEIAAHLHLSPSHFQRLFTRWAGVSPKKFLQYLTLQHARRQLLTQPNLEAVAFHSGLSGTGRLHDLFVRLEGMTPAQYRKQGAGLTLRYGVHEGPFGEFLLALSPSGAISCLHFLDADSDPRALLRQQWEASTLVEDQEATAAIATGLFGKERSDPVRLLARGTPFQLKVWEALLRIPEGHLVSYQHIARYIGNPSGLQAVGSAVGKNPIAWLIPCHRVIRKNGEIHAYRWGPVRKSAILGWEAARRELEEQTAPARKGDP
jgi:AraC family transcriptional regulator of adaptative response/methylated-DNA-[protein]-cysteine methyltransferase